MPSIRPSILTTSYVSHLIAPPNPVRITQEVIDLFAVGAVGELIYQVGQPSLQVPPPLRMADIVPDDLVHITKGAGSHTSHFTAPAGEAQGLSVVEARVPQRETRDPQSETNDDSTHKP